MARNQKNFDLQLYVDDNGDSWNKRGEVGGAAAGVDGHAALNPAFPVWIDSGRQRVRRVVYMDPTTFRTVDPVFYTPAAYAAVAPGDVIAVQVEGLATTVNYAAVRKIPEKQPRRAASRQLADA